MYYLIEIPEAEEPHLTHILLESFYEVHDPIPYAVADDALGNACPMRHVQDYYESEIRPQYDQLPQWRDLPEETRVRLGADLASYVGFLFPGMTLDDALAPDIAAELLHFDGSADVAPIALRGL